MFLPSLSSSFRIILPYTLPPAPPLQSPIADGPSSLVVIKVLALDNLRLVVAPPVGEVCAVLRQLGTHGGHVWCLGADYKLLLGPGRAAAVRSRGSGVVVVGVGLQRWGGFGYGLG